MYVAHEQSKTMIIVLCPALCLEFQTRANVGSEVTSLAVKYTLRRPFWNTLLTSFVAGNGE
jgi:hypothetical protein